MRFSLLDTIKRAEGFRSQIYLCTSQKRTIGYGLNLDSGLSEDLAAHILFYQLHEIEARLENLLPFWVELNQARKDALIEMAFQLGVSGLLNFKKMIKALENKSFELAKIEALDSLWYTQTPARAKRIAHQICTGIYPNG